MPRATNPYDEPDSQIAQALNEIYSSYGVIASATLKAKSLRKFGQTNSADNGVDTTVSYFQGSVVNETFATSNSVDYIVSDDASDTQDILVEGHYFDADNNFIFATQYATLQGTTPVALATPLCRANRMRIRSGTFASPSTLTAGNIYVYDATLATGVTAGVPDVAAATKCVLQAGKSTTQKCATTISYRDYWIIEGFYVSIQKGNSSTVNADADIEYREIGGVWTRLGLNLSLRSGSQSSLRLPLVPYGIIPSNSDVRAVVSSNTNSTSVTAYMNGFLAIDTASA